MERTGAPDGIHLGLEQLRAEHADRTTWLARALRDAPETDWTAVRAGVTELHQGVTVQERPGGDALFDGGHVADAAAADRRRSTSEALRTSFRIARRGRRARTAAPGDGSRPCADGRRRCR
ncbi:DUF5984 family protein [Microbispora sp. NPDC088329]|uniref:DUF5984 family protein n=1 Tax=Microbispora sp. NPDC088329 TaxID=3154869 RepID=UPI003426185F